MSIDKLKRVIWRLQEMKTATPGVYNNKQIRLAIMEECGTDERTIRTTINKLAELGMLTPDRFGWMRVTMDSLSHQN